MLLEFTVKNFLSIKEAVTLSMVASTDATFEDNLLPYIDGKKEKNALKSAIIYGANASGKSNILKALKFFNGFIRKSHEMQPGRIITREPFKLDIDFIEEPSEFQIVFIHEKIKYLYGFSVTKDEVVEEYLYYYPNSRQSLIFERKKDEYKFTVDIERQTEIKKKFHSPNKLFISTESIWEYDKAKIPFEWLSEHLNIYIDHERLEGYTGANMEDDENFAYLVKKFMKQADVGIDDISVEVKKASELFNSEVFQFLSEEGRSEILNKIKDDDVLNIKTYHFIEDENGNVLKQAFQLSDESEGTQKFFGLLGPWVDALVNGYTLVIDELDIRLHTLLVKKLVEMFLNPAINRNNAQLIFTTHDTNLLDSNLFRRDQIWFAEKREDKSTDLYSLYDFGGVRKNISIEKGYLQGKYGAIPVLKGEWLWD